MYQGFSVLWLKVLKKFNLFVLNKIKHKDQLIGLYKL
jgi:hypothetical protein